MIATSSPAIVPPRAGSTPTTLYTVSRARPGVTNGTSSWSPKTGRAVSLAAGEPFKDRLLPLPAFLRGRIGNGVQGADLHAGLALAGHFLETRLYGPHAETLPEPRRRLTALLCPPDRPHVSV